MPPSYRPHPSAAKISRTNHRVLVQESSGGPTDRLNYPDGFVSHDGQYLDFAYNDNRHRAVYYKAKLPPTSTTPTTGPMTIKKPK